MAKYAKLVTQHALNVLFQIPTAQPAIKDITSTALLAQTARLDVQLVHQLQFVILVRMDSN